MEQIKEPKPEERALHNKLCYDPYHDTYVTNADRNTRPVTTDSGQNDAPSKDDCPFCKIYSEYPEKDYNRPIVIRNGFPSHVLENTYKPVPAEPLTDPFHTLPAHGHNEVILYPKGRGKCEYKLDIKDDQNIFAAMPIDYLLAILNTLIARFKSLMDDYKTISYIALFENSGAAAGSSVEHGHCQLYACSFVPKNIKMECENADAYYKMHQKNLFTAELEHELEIRERILYQNESFIVFVPPYNEFPFAVKVLPKRFVNTILDLTEKEINDLAEALKATITAYDHLFEESPDRLPGPFPYMMGLKSSPINPISEQYCFHVEIIPPMRSAKQAKLNACMENIFFHHINPVLTSEAVEMLRKAFEKAKLNLGYKV